MDGHSGCVFDYDNGLIIFTSAGRLGNLCQECRKDSGRG